MQILMDLFQQLFRLAVKNVICGEKQTAEVDNFTSPLLIFLHCFHIT